VNRKIQTISALPQKSQKYKGKSVNNPLFIEALEIRRKLLDTDVYMADHWSWRFINDYIAVVPLGWKIKIHDRKIREAIIKYGAESTFWTELERTKSLRKKQTLRLSNCVRIGGDMLDKGGLTRGIRGSLNKFKSVALDLRKKLLVNPLTEKQMEILWMIERICGIYYTDLTPEENGEIWKGENEKT
jgi:hypothetical protein